MPSYQYRKSHCGYKTILPPSYLHNGFPILKLPEYKTTYDSDWINGQGMSGKVQRENPGQHRREFGELKTQDSSQRHSSSVRGHHRSRPRGPPGDEESRSETRPKPDVMGGPLQGRTCPPLGETLGGFDPMYTVNDPDYAQGQRIHHSLTYKTRPFHGNSNDSIQWDTHLSSVTKSNLPRPIIPEPRANNPQDRRYISPTEDMEDSTSSSDDDYIVFPPREAMPSDFSSVPYHGYSYDEDLLGLEMPGPGEAEGGAVAAEERPPPGYGWRFSGAGAATAHPRMVYPYSANTSPHHGYRHDDYPAAAAGPAALHPTTDDHDIRRYPNDLEERRRKLEQQHLYQEVKRRGGASRSDMISFGEGVPGQGYNESTYVLPEVTYTSHKRSRSSPTDSDRKTLPKPCRYPDCPYEGKPAKRGYCSRHFKDLSQQGLMPNPIPANRSQHPPPVHAMKTNPMANPPRAARPPVVQQPAARNPPPVAPVIGPCKGRGCQNAGEPELNGLCNNCHSYYTVASDPQMMKDYEHMVANIIKVSAQAKQKCRTEGCDNFGNCESQWYCNQCYCRSQQNGQSEDPLPESQDNQHDMQGGTELKTPDPTPTTSNVGAPRGIENDIDRNRESFSGDRIRHLVTTRRFKCKSPACNNFGNEAHEGYCNSCFQAFMCFEVSPE